VELQGRLRDELVTRLGLSSPPTEQRVGVIP
jgi:hypothetical protein